MPKVMPTSLPQLIEGYDVFFVDQFGVLRDDAGPYEGAVTALAELAFAGRKVVILSNSGRSGEYNSERLVKLGFSSESFDFFVTSGDVAFDILSRPENAIGEKARCLTISSGGDSNLADRLGLVSTDNAFEAEIVIISGSEAERIPMDVYREMLHPAAKKGIPCYCTNPDIHKLNNGSIAPGGGSIAKLYESMGGPVTWLGKPYPEIYEHALRLAGVTDRRRVVCVGDSIDHDILGAKSAGLDSVLVRTGILADVNEEQLKDLYDRARAYPTHILQRFALQPGCDV
ncbi:TIGR01459 family HAD-type hydrolase [Rhizobium sp. BK377]|uniref:TIGR01459 family HAD-type hydrolase n=1 Tax=Rhizobium sp. BK377 TaxID=2587058 RepID=UPI0016143CF5|nr:TIGR01459 family HAD-type hydrolase [Rhizobium sp. BK377]MBB3464292.1 HAD superfamily hydrolase (TIGR01459 family) [Rhizobium sp. BK377]